MAKKILVVDDEPGTLEFYKVLFQDEGFDVKAAADATTAIILCVDFKPDLILLDWDIPGGGGERVFEKVRESQGADVPVLFVTGYPEKIVAEKLAGATAVLKKPVTTEDLLARTALLLKKP